MAALASQHPRCDFQWCGCIARLCLSNKCCLSQQIWHPSNPNRTSSAADVHSGYVCLACAAYHGSFGLPASRVGLPVRPNHAIDAELGIIREAAKVTAICPVLHLLSPRALGCVDEALVHPVPYEPPLQMGMPVKSFPVLLKQSQRWSGFEWHERRSQNP